MVMGETSQSAKRLTTLDWISALEDSLLIHILCFVPTLEAVRMSILGKRWLYLWKSLPVLEFHCISESSDDIQKLVSFVTNSLVFHTAPKIRSFKVAFLYSKCYHSDVYLWLRVLSAKRVETLVLWLSGELYPEDEKAMDDSLYSLPDFIYSNDSLNKLTLSNCLVKPPSGKISWESLVELKICYSPVSNNVIQMIPSGCPQLKNLEFLQCWGYDELRLELGLSWLCIDGYAHEYRDIYDCDSIHGPHACKALKLYVPYVKHLLLMNTFFNTKLLMLHAKRWSLESVDLLFSVEHVHDEVTTVSENQSMLLDMLNHFGSVNELQVGPWCLQVLSMIKVKNLPMLTADFNCCTRLLLCCHFVKEDLPGIAYLLQCLPSLKEIEIDCEFADKCEVEVFASSTISYDLEEQTFWVSQKEVGKSLSPKLEKLRIESRSKEYRPDNIFAFAQFLHTHAKNFTILELPRLSETG